MSSASDGPSGRPRPRGHGRPRERLRRARRRHRARPAAPRRARRRRHARRTSRTPSRAAIDGNADRRRDDARRARGRPADPGGAPRGVPPGRVAAAPRDGHDRRQPAPGDALLVLAARVPVLPARRRPLPRARGRAPRARDLRERPLRVGAPVRSGRGAARARRDRRDDARASCRSPSSTGCRPTTTASLTTLGRDELILELDVPAAGRERLPEGDGPRGAGRSRSSASRPRASADDVRVGARRRGADPVAARPPSDLDDATPLPGTAYKVELARVLVRRAARRRLRRDDRRRGNSLPSRSRVRLLATLVVACLCASAYALAAGEETSPALAAPAPRPRCAGARAGLPRCLRRFRRGFDAAARDTGLPLALLVAVAERESGLRPDVVSSAGARGLLQLMPATAAELSVDADRPESNVLGGARYLRAMLDRFARPTSRSPRTTPARPPSPARRRSRRARC